MNFGAIGKSENIHGTSVSAELGGEERGVGAGGGQLLNLDKFNIKNITVRDVLGY